MALKDYPDYVLAFKGKGKEIRFLNGKYYLYQIHSSRINGKVKKFTDKYLGRITENGLIPPTIKHIEYKVLEYASFVLATNACKNIIDSIKGRYKATSNMYLSNAFFTVIFNNDLKRWNKSYFSVVYKDFKITKHTEKVTNEINRVTSMVKHSINSFLKNININDFLYLINDLYMVGVKDNYTLALYSDETKQILDKHNMEVNYGESK